MAAPLSRAEHIPGIAGGDLPEPERLAFEEGHDADLSAQTTSHTSDAARESYGEVEKGSKRDISSTSSENGDHDVEKGQPMGTAVSGEGEDAKEGEGTAQDPNIVDWEGPDDPQNPMNWKPAKKWANIAILSFLTLLTPLASSMFAPGVPDVIKEFHSTKYVDLPLLHNFKTDSFSTAVLHWLPSSCRSTFSDSQPVRWSLRH